MPARPSVPAIREAIAVAKADFGAAATAGDMERLAGHFEAGATVVDQHGQALIGARAIVARLAAAGARGQPTKVAFVSNTAAFCVDGAHEYSGYYRVFFGDIAASPEFSGPYAIRWVLDSIGRARVRSVTFNEFQATRAPKRGDCLQQHAGRLEGRRLTVLAGPTLTGAGAWRTGPGIGRTLSERGWSRSVRFVVRENSPTIYTIHANPVSEENHVGRQVGARYRFAREYSLEVGADLAPHVVTVNGYRAESSTEPGSAVTVHSTSREAHALVWRQWHVLRIGVGPQLAKGRFVVSYDSVLPLEGTRGLVRGAHHVRTAEAVTIARSYGLRTSAAVSIPLTSMFFAEVAGAVRVMSGSKVAGTRDYASSQVPGHGASMAIGLGVSF